MARGEEHLGSDVDIDEGARKLPQEVTNAVDLPWRMITGFRNMAVHEYFSFDMGQVWVTVHEDLPELVAKCNSFLQHSVVK